MWVSEFAKEETLHNTREKMRERIDPVNVRECLNRAGKTEEYLLKFQWDTVQLALKLDK